MADNRFMVVAIFAAVALFFTPDSSFTNALVSRRVLTRPKKATQLKTATLEDVGTMVGENAMAQQAQAEEIARGRHDVYAMNALFVPVEENPDPKVCSVQQGTIPADFPPGCLLRVGPNGASKDEGWLDGDGMIQCVVVPPASEGDLPLFSSTYVETRGRYLEQKLQGEVGDQKRFRGILGAAPDGLPMLKSLVQNGLDFQTMVSQKDTCNTAMALSGDRVLALMEQSPPSEIAVSKDGRIRTVGHMQRLDGAVKDAPITGGSFGAHGRTDPQTGERVHVSYNSASKPFVRVDTFADDWNLVSSMDVDIPAPVMVHDSAITKNHVVILDFPLTVRPRRFLQNKFPVQFEPENGARIGLTPRHKATEGTSETIWFDVEPGVVLHVANAFERPDGNVVLHGFKSLPKGDSSFILDYTTAFLHEWVLDPATGRVINDMCLNPNELVEFPIVEGRLVSQNAEFIYGLQVTGIGGPITETKTPQIGVLLDGMVKFSTKQENAGEVVGRFSLDQGWHFCTEPTVVTKTTGDGRYVLVVATFVPEGSARDKGYDDLARDGSSLKSQMLIFDGDSISSGPVTTIALPHHVPYGLHSLFLPWEKMK